MMVTLVSFGLAIIVGHVLYTSMVDSGALTQTPEATTIANNTLEQFSIWDNLFLAAFIGLALTSIISAAFIRTSPLFFALSLILFVIVLIVGVFISNMWGDIATQGAFSGEDTAFPKMFFMMNNLLLFLIPVGALIIIALYSTKGRQQLGI